jgi:acyl carrier protein
MSVTVHRADLLAALEAWGLDPADLRDDHQPLISGGLLDSMALFNLSMWLEERLGEPIDPSGFDVLSAWDSVAAILAFLRERGAVVPDAAPAGSPGTASPTAADVAAPPAVAPVDAPVAPPVGSMSAAADPYRIERFAPAHRAAVMDLMRALWSEDPRVNDAVFAWKYEHSPFDPEPLVYVALREGVPVAVRAFARFTWERPGGAPVTLPVADDWVVSDAARNDGLFQRFTEAARADLRARGHDGYLSLSALRVTRLQSLATGSRSGAAIPVWGWRPAVVRRADALMRLVDRLPGGWRLARRWQPGRRSASAFERLDRTPERAVEGLRLRFLAEAPAAAMADLAARRAPPEGWRQRRDEAVFAWRFAHPLQRYRFATAWEGDRLVGWIALQRGLAAGANPRRVNLVDWDATRAPVLSLLLGALTAASDVAELATWVLPPQSDWAAVLSAAGFMPTDAHQRDRGLPCVLTRALDGEAAAARWEALAAPLLQPQAWDLRMADTSYA